MVILGMAPVLPKELVAVSGKCTYSGFIYLVLSCTYISDTLIDNNCCCTCTCSILRNRGWCGFSAEHCGANSTQGTTIPTDPNAGRCGRGDGDEGDGTCLGENECCSEFGYCGTGNKYCYTQIDTETNESSEGLCGAGDAGEGTCVSDTHCCSKFGVSIFFTVHPVVVSC